MAGLKLANFLVGHRAIVPKTLASALTRNQIKTHFNAYARCSLHSEVGAHEAIHWKPMCLYHTQGLCTMMRDPMHLEKFNHNFSADLNYGSFKHLRNQEHDYYLVLDLEGKVEILEFPVVMIDARTLEFVDCFHRFVRPVQMSERRIKEYIEGKYGKLGVDRVWFDTAITFQELLPQFELWMTQHLLLKEREKWLHQAAFVTCGNWDLKTKVPQQCEVSCIELPSYFREWINLKDIYLNFYNKRATGMMAMMKGLGISMMGSHHLGIDDAKNITRVLQQMLADGALLQITARRKQTSKAFGNVEFLLKNRIV
ncbi:hypothetical protein AMTRI_Chr01g111270 [Amborella trichopoda]